MTDARLSNKMGSGPVQHSLAFGCPALSHAVRPYLSLGILDCQSCDEMLFLPTYPFDWHWRGVITAAGSDCVLCGVRKVMAVWPDSLPVCLPLAQSGVV